ncbi:MAG: glycosyltransferase family 2 protein [Anaerolineaceae bacterium]|nr:glycosyltransferase family 2 protein [Anaerolineaceae bacterium]
MADGNEKILALLPAYNEEAHLGAVLEAVKLQISDILVVDDGSKDNTAEAARASGVELLSRGYNLGKGESLKEGYTWALDRGYDAVIMLDSDGQHDPACIRDFIAKYRETHSPLIIGARDYSRIPLRRRIPNMIGKALFSAAVGQEIPDNQSGYRMLNRQLMERMLGSKESGYHFEVEMIAICIAENWPIEWVRIPTIYADEKSSQNPFDQIFGFPKMCLNARKIVREKRKK